MSDNLVDDAAQRDRLTGCLTRPGFERSLDLETERARRAGGKVALIICELDHEPGDRALVKVAGLLRKGKRRIDTVARLGGGQFGLLLPGSDAAGALVVAERLCESIRDAFAR